MTAALDNLLGPAEATPEWDPRLGDHLSASRLSKLYKCPEQYRRQYLLGEWGVRGSAIHWGDAHHRALEANFEQKITSHEDLPLDEVLDRFRDAFVDNIDAVQWEPDEKPAPLMDMGSQLVENYHTLVAPRVQPLAVEESFTLQIPGVPVPVIGRLDLRGLVDGQRRIVEFKTAGKSVAKPKDDWRFQGRVYRHATGTPVEWHVAVKNTAAAIVTPLEKPALLFEPSDGLAVTVTAAIRSRARLLMALYTELGVDQSWPDGLEHTFACDYCPFGPTRGDSSCAYWEGQA